MHNIMGTNRNKLTVLKEAVWSVPSYWYPLDYDQVVYQAQGFSTPS